MALLLALLALADTGDTADTGEYVDTGAEAEHVYTHEEGGCAGGGSAAAASVFFCLLRPRRSRALQPPASGPL